MPSRPAKGEVLIVKIIAIVGSSIWMRGSGRSFGVVTVSPILDSFHACDRQNVARPADGFIHALQAFEGIQFRDLGLLKRSIELDDTDFIAQRSVPLNTRTIARRPRYSL